MFIRENRFSSFLKKIFKKKIGSNNTGSRILLSLSPCSATYQLWVLKQGTNPL